MPLLRHKTGNATLPAANDSRQQKRGVSFRNRPQPWASLLKAILLNCALAVLVCGFSQAGTYLTLSSPGIAGGGGGSTVYISSFGTVNALAVNGSTAAGVTAAALGNGALYYLPITANISVQGGNASGYLTAYVSTNFAHPAALVMYGCPNTGGCSGGTTGYSALSTNAAAPTSLVASPGVASGTNVTIGVALFVPDNDGASAWTGTDLNLTTITFSVMQIHNGNGNVTTAETDTLTFTLPNVTLQTAVSLDLATGASGLTISPGADYSMNFGNVNALGINPAAGITTVAAGGGIIYATPYLYNVAFGGFASTTATINVYVSMNFVHSAILQLEDSSAKTGPYASIGTTVGTQTQITNAAGDRSSTTRYLGLFISNVNGAGSFRGTDNATLTYTMTVP